MLACDLFTGETAWIDRLHVLFFIEIASRTDVWGAKRIRLWVAIAGGGDA